MLVIVSLVEQRDHFFEFVECPEIYLCFFTFDVSYEAVKIFVSLKANLSDKKIDM